MFDFDAGKLMIIATVALVVIGPKDLPRVLRQFGQMVTRVRRMASEFQGQFMDAVKEADLQDIRAEVAKLKDSATLDVAFNPIHDIKTHLNDAISAPVGSVAATAALGSAPEIGAVTHASSSDVEPAASIAAAGFGPAIDIPALPEPVHLDAQPSIMGAMAEEPARSPRKAVLVRRRAGARMERSGASATSQRPRNILPARRETPDR